MNSRIFDNINYYGGNLGKLLKNVQNCPFFNKNTENSPCFCDFGRLRIPSPRPNGEVAVLQPPLPLSDNMNGKKISRRKNSVGIFILDVYLFNGQGGVYTAAERYADGKQRRQSHIYHVARIERNYKATVIQRAYSHRQYSG